MIKPNDCVHCPHNRFKNGISTCNISCYKDLPSINEKCIYEYMEAQK